MNKWRKRVVAFLIVLCAGVAWGGTDPGKAIGLAAMGDVDAALVTRVRGFAQSNLYMPMVVVDVEGVENGSLDDVGRNVAEKFTPDLAFIVVLCVPDGEVDAHGTLMKELNVAVVNMTAMQTDDAEKFARRIERQVMRSVGLLLGLDYSPNPQSVMWPYKTLDQLDRIGRNFDPPWLIKAHDAARKAGIEIIPFAWRFGEGPTATADTQH